MYLYICLNSRKGTSSIFSNSLIWGLLSTRPMFFLLRYFQYKKTRTSCSKQKNVFIMLFTSFWPQKVVFSARAKLKLISDQARDLIRNCFEGQPLSLPFKTTRVHPGCWVNRLSQESYHVMIYEEKVRVIERE